LEITVRLSNNQLQTFHDAGTQAPEHQKAVAMTTAVLVIDVQQGLCEGEGAAFDCAGTISRINLVTRKARAAGALVIFIQHESTSAYLAHGSHAWQLAKGLEADPTDARIRKTTPDAFLRTELENVLRSRAVDKVIVRGMHSEFCVDTTTRRALALGFPVLLVSDGHTSAGNTAISAQQVIAHHNATLTNISSFGPRVQAVAAENMRFETAQIPHLSLRP
jgi:nicotinamidase-related amidase